MRITEREREREEERKRCIKEKTGREQLEKGGRKCVCVCEREREREREKLIKLRENKRGRKNLKSRWR